MNKWSDLEGVEEVPLGRRSEVQGEEEEGVQG